MAQIVYLEALREKYSTLDPQQFAGLQAFLSGTSVSALVRQLVWARDLMENGETMKVYEAVIADLTAIDFSDPCDKCHRYELLNNMLHTEYNGIQFWLCLDCARPVIQTLSATCYAGKTREVAKIWCNLQRRKYNGITQVSEGQSWSDIWVYERTNGDIFLHQQGAGIVYQDNLLININTTLERDARAITRGEVDDWSESWVHPLDAVTSIIEDSQLVAIWYSTTHTYDLVGDPSEDGRRFLQLFS